MKLSSPHRSSSTRSVSDPVYDSAFGTAFHEMRVGARLLFAVMSCENLVSGAAVGSATERRVFVTALVAVASHIWAGAMAFVVALGKQASGTVKPRNPRHFDSFGGERIGIKK